MKALAFLALVIKRGGAAAATALWAEELARSTRIEGGSQRASGSTSTRHRRTFVLLACADSTEASATRMRHAALRLLCRRALAAQASSAGHGGAARVGCCQRGGPGHPQRRGDASAARSLRRRSRRARGRSCRSARATLREECETEYERLEMSRAARDGSGSGDGRLPLRERARAISPSTSGRAAHQSATTGARKAWCARDAGLDHGGLLNLGQKLGDCDHKKLQDAGVTNLRFAFDRGSDAGG